MEQNPFRKADSHSAGQEIPSLLRKEPEGSLPWSQAPSSGPYAEPAESSSYPNITLHFINNHLDIIFPSTHVS